MCKGHTKQRAELVTQVLVQTYQRLMYLRLVHQVDGEGPEKLINHARL